MKTTTSFATCAMLLLIPAGLAWQADNSGKEVRLEGVVTDSMCGARHMMAGDDAKCVRTCVKGGSHYALLVKDKVYQLSGQDDALEQLAGETVRVTGTWKNGDVILVMSVKAGAQGVSGKSDEDRVMHTHHPTGDADGTAGAVQGYVRDVACLLRNAHAGAATTPLTQDCLEKCVRGGSPIAILTEQGEIYLPISDVIPDTDAKRQLLPYAGKYVRATGQLFERGGLHAISINTIDVISKPRNSKIPVL